MRWLGISLVALAGCATVAVRAGGPSADAVGPQGAGGSVDGGYSLEGVVVAHGAPASGAEVLVDGQVAAVSDGRGAFALRTDRVEPWVMARAGALLSGVVHLDGHRPPAAGLLLALGAPSSLRGEVRDALTGKPLSGAQILLDGARTAAADAQGEFTIPSFSGSGDDLVVVRAEGHAALETRVDLSLRRPVAAVFALSAGRSAAVRVVTPEGKPLAGAEVAITDGDSAHVFQTATAGPDGVARLEGLPLGLLLAKASAPGWAGLGLPLSGPELALVLQPEATLGGRLVTPNHTPVLRGRVEARMTEPASAEGSASAEGGAFAISGLAAGTYHLSAAVPGRARADLGTVDLAAGEHHAADWVLPDGPGLTGRVIDGATGQPVADARVGIAAVGSEVLPAATDADGGFELALSRFEPVRLHAEAEGYVPTELEARPGVPAQIALDRGVRVQGRVVDAEGGALQGASIDDDEATGPDGRFDVHRPAVTERIAISRFGSLGVEVPLAVAGGAVDVGDVTMREGILVHLRVVDPAGAPVAGAEIFGAGETPLVRKEILRGGLPQIGLTDPSGVATFRVAPIKSCAVAVHPAFAPSSKDQCPLELSREGQTAQLQLLAPAWLEGLMLRTGPGLDAAVSADESPSDVPDSAGHFRVGPLSPGHHDFFAFEGYSQGHPRRVWFWQGDLVAGQTLRHDFGNPEGASVEVQVDHLRARTVMVGLLRVEGSGQGEATMHFVEPTNGTVQVKIPAVSAGEYKLAVSDGMDTGASRMVPITLQPHEARTLKLDFEAMVPVVPGE